MSLYNQVCGNHPLFWVLARIIESPARLPQLSRFRDIWTREVDGVPQIVIYTRTGGNNRVPAEDEVMAAHPLFVTTWDDTFDNTFAHFAFNVPDRLKDRMLRFHRLFSKHPKGMSPKEKFDRALAELSNKPVAEIEFTDADMHEVVELAKDMLTDVRDEVSTIELRVRPYSKYSPPKD